MLYTENWGVSGKKLAKGVCTPFKPTIGPVVGAMCGQLWRGRGCVRVNSCVMMVALVGEAYLLASANRLLEIGGLHGCMGVCTTLTRQVAWEDPWSPQPPASRLIINLKTNQRPWPG
jgi:hypothetical protein